MSGGKKRSGFQITSVTSEDGGSPASKPDTSTSPPPPADQVTPTSIVLNGPAFLHNFSPTLLTQQSSSQPTTPVSVRKQRSLEQVGGGASRFRVVRLGQGSGEPYRRGRWTCVDVVEREAELRGVRRVMDSMRHAHSLESLESVGLNEVVAAGGGVTIKSFNMRGLRPGPGVHLQGSAHLLTHSGPPSPTFNYHDSPILSPPPPHTPDVHRPRKVPPPLHLDLDPASKLRVSRSQPSSPGPPAGRDGLLFHPSPSALALAQSMLGVGGTFELVSDDGGSSTGMVAIDNKIEQAMDLVKAHLMQAVREEVEVLREHIKELSEKNAQLERENYILKALRDQH